MANEYLKRTPTSTGNQRVWTWSGWVKKCAISGSQHNLWRVEGGASGDSGFRFDLNTPADSLRFYLDGAAVADLRENAKRRDTSSWMHVMVSYNTTSPISYYRIQLYLNGSKVSNFAASTYPPQNRASSWNDLVTHNIGAAPTFSEWSSLQMSDIFFVDGQSLTPDVFGFHKENLGYISEGTTQSTDFRRGQWVPKSPNLIKRTIVNSGGFGVNGFYLPLNDSSNFGADFHCTPNSIITLKGETLPQPRNGAPTTTDNYISQLRTDPLASNLVLAIPFISGGLQSGFGDYSNSINSSTNTKTVQLITYNGTTPTISTLDSYYGSACRINGNGSTHTGGHIRVTDNNIFQNLNLTTANWTIEGWFRPTTRSATGGSNLFNFGSSIDYQQIQVLLDPTGDIWHLWSTNGSSWTTNDAGTTGRIPLNEWSHIAFEKSGTNITTYVNGVAAKTTIVSSNINYTASPRLIIGGHYMSGSPGGDTYYYDGWVSDVRMYNVAKYKGGFDVPKPYTPINFTSWRALSDSCTNNFATLNPLRLSSDGTTLNGRTITNGNLTATNTALNQGTSATISVNSGKWYWETRLDVFQADNIWMGIFDENLGGGYSTPQPVDTNQWYLQGNDELIVYGSSGSVYRGSVNTASSLATIRSGDILGIAVDLSVSNTAPTVSFYKNGVLQHTSTGSISTTTTPSGYWRPAYSFGGGATGWVISVNFGQNPTFSGNTTAGTFTDSNGKGLFKYQPPTGFLALCEDNLPTPTIPDPGKYFKTVLYTGDGNGNRNITGVGFQPDLVWIKDRSNGSYNHLVMDSVRGAGLALRPSAIDAESTSGIRAFSNDGFSLTGDVGWNTNGNNHVAWCWKAGDTIVTNNDGGITSTVSANQTSGFSIVTYSGNGSNPTTVGHGLGRPPKFIIFKCRNATVNWFVYHGALGPSGNFEGINTTTAYYASTPVFFGNTAPSSSVITLGGVDANTNGRNYVAYCWAEIDGFSKFGSYIGNGNVDGPFVYCGFKPAFVLIKNASSAYNWYILDNSRSSTNPTSATLAPNLTTVEDTGWTTGVMDFTSNGFKLRGTNVAINETGSTFVYAAFAESPFKYANAK